MKLGLTPSQSTLYLTLLKFGASDVQTLITQTGFYKSNIYLSLERLCEKGIISKIIEKGKRIYQLESPNSFLEYINNKKDELKTQEKLAKEIIEEVKLTKKHISLP